MTYSFFCCGFWLRFFVVKSEKRYKRHLIIDEYAAGIVRKIFNLKLDGVNSENIANRLNAEGVLSPFNYKRMNDLNYHSGFKTGEQISGSDI